MNTHQQVYALITAFEQGTLPVKQWTHQAHVVMALWYLYYEPLPQARQRIKEGIKRYNESVGGSNTENSGYHETLTELYIRVVGHYLLSSATNNFEKLLRHLSAQPFWKSHFPFSYYRQERLMSPIARRQWLSPDLRPLSDVSFVPFADESN